MRTDYKLLYESTLAAKQELDAQHKLLGEEVKRLNAKLDTVRNEAAALEPAAYDRGREDEREMCLAEIETGIWLDKTTEEVLAEIAAAIRARGKAAVKAVKP